MTLTRKAVETELLSRLGEAMTAAGMDTTPHGSISALNSPLAFAMRQIGIAPAGVFADSDAAQIGDDALDKFYTLAEWRLLENILGNFTGVDFSLGPRRENFDQIRTGLERRLARLEARIKTEYRIGGARLSAGVLRVPFSETNE